MGGIYVDFSVVNQLNSPALNSNTFANRPAAGQIGRLFISTDTFEIYRDNGTTWDLIGGPGSSTITGTGTANTFAIFTGAQSIGNSSYLTQGTNAINISNADLILPANNTIGGTNYSISQVIANNDKWKIYGNTIGIDAGEMVFAVTDNNVPIALGGQRFRFTYTNNLDVIFKDVFFIDYNDSYFNTNLGINVPSPSGLIHADGGANVARMILDADNNVARIFSFRTDNLQRWAFRVDGNETGGDTGANFQLRRYDDTGAFIDASLIVNRATGKKTFNATQNYTSGLATGNSMSFTLNVPSGTTFTSPNSISPILASMVLNLAGNATIQSGSRTGADFYNSVGFSGAGTLTMSQAATIRALSNLKTGWAYNGSAIGTITHSSGINILFPDNSGQPLNITNNYALLINRQDANTGTITYTNRWGIYQEGSADLNYLNGNLLIKSNIDNGNALQVTGNANANSFIPTSATIPTNGMFLPNTNTLGFSTNTIQRITISSSGAVGIGNLAPVSLLSLAGTYAKSLSNEDTWHLQIKDQTAMTTGVGGGIVLTGNYTTGGASASFAAISGYKENSTSSNGLGQLRLYSSDTNSILQLRATINGAGNLLIGTTTDSGEKLQVNGTSYLNGNVGIGVNASQRLHINTIGSAASEIAVLLRNPSQNFADCTTELIFQGGYTSTYEGAASIRGGRATASNDGYLSIFTNPGGNNVIERIRVKETGQMRFVPLAADPGGAQSGDVYYNSGTNKLRLYDGTNWVDLN